MPPPTSQENTRARILAVDDEVLNLELLQRALRREYEVMVASTPQRALELLASEPNVAVILSDYMMPGMTGTDFLAETLASHPDTKRVIISAYADSDAVVRATDAGEVDFIIKKPWNRKQLHQLLLQFVQAYWLARENRTLSDELREVNEGPAVRRKPEDLVARQELKIKLEQRSAPTDEDAHEDDDQELVASHEELPRAEHQLVGPASLDPITGLYSEEGFRARLRQELARARRYERMASLLVAEIDDFEGLVRESGHERGREMLRTLARLITSEECTRVRESDVVARVHDAGFAILLVETDRSGAAVKASRLREAVAQVEWPGISRLTMCIGMACAPDDTADATMLLEHAERALASARSTGRNRQALHVQQPRPEYRDEHEFLAQRMAPSIPTVDTGAFRMVHTLVSEFARGLSHSRARTALWIDMSAIERLRPLLGRGWYASTHERVADTLQTMLGAELQERDRLCRTASHDFMCLLTPERASGADARDPSRVAEAVAARLIHVLAPLVPHDIAELAYIPVAGARVLAPSSMATTAPARLLDELIRRAKNAATELARSRARRHEEQLITIIANGQLSALYQPIVAFDHHHHPAAIIGHHALVRGPQHMTTASSWRALLLSAELASSALGSQDVANELDRAVVARVLGAASGLAMDQRLFVSLRPRTLCDTAFMHTHLSGFLSDNPVSPGNVVLCLTERDALDHFVEMRRALPVYMSRGFAVAIQEVGGQYSDLEALVQLEPRFISPCAQLTRGLAGSRRKRDVLLALVCLAKRMDAKLVAVDVDRADDVGALLDVGVRYGRGDFLARPGAPFPRVRNAIKRTLARLASSQTPSAAPPADAERPLESEESGGTESEK